MPSNKIITALVLCVGIVTSIWLLQREPENVAAIKNDSVTAVANQNDLKNEVGVDWKGTLESVGRSPAENPENIAADNNSDSFEETTLTAQMSRDFFSQYLMLKKGGQPITPLEINKIVENTLSSPEYTKAVGAMYLTSNLRINQNSNTENLIKYRDLLSKSLKDRLGEIQTKEDPMTILVTAVKKDDEKEIAKLDPIILAGKGIISDLLEMEVPKEAVIMHLSLLNASSNLLLNLEQMRVTLTDPIRSFAGANQYPQHMTEFQTALANLTAYLNLKTQ